MDAGKLRQRVQLLSLQKQENRYCYEPVKNTFAAVKVTGRTGIFSKIGIGAEGVELPIQSCDGKKPDDLPGGKGHA